MILLCCMTRVEAIEGESGAETSERVSCDEASRFRLSRGEAPPSPSIATNSNNTNSCRDTWDDRGERGGGVRNVVRTGPTR